MPERSSTATLPGFVSDGHRQFPHTNHNTKGGHMPTVLGELGLEEAAKQASGNWRGFKSFAWHRATDLDDGENWAILYTHNRDSGLLDVSNAAAIAKALEPFTEGDDPDVVGEQHDHWACGWIDGFSIRVFRTRSGEITEAFKVYHALTARMTDYPVLDESDYSEREYEAALENIGLSAWRLKRDFALPDGWESSVFDWLWQHRDHALENVDDQGGWPEEDDIVAAFVALGYPRAA